MMKIYILLFMYIIFSLGIVHAQNTHKSTQTEGVPVDTVADEVTEAVVISDGGDSVDGKWFINDGDPSGWEINQVYDEDLDSYVDELIGHKKEGDENNSDSFILWAPSDSGVLWKLASPVVKFKIKIVDGQDWNFGNIGNMGLYFWITIWDDYKMEYRTRKVRYNKGTGLLDNGEHWSDYTPHGMGEDIDDGEWHEVIVNLTHDIQESRDTACSHGDANACKYWKFYGITGLEVRAVHIYMDDITVLPDTTITGVPERSSAPDRLNIYPNPSRGEITLDFDLGEASIDVFNVIGKRVLSFENVRPGQQLSLESLREGVYFVCVRNRDKKYVRKLLIR